MVLAIKLKEGHHLPYILPTYLYDTSRYSERWAVIVEADGFHQLAN